ncbi:DUF2293 domain-containing protein [Roseibacillus persicicus]|uniref:DUF2293 domain-containing protein n=1 Tax=Roseibacillus persicicus TaxID=454148 RepID=UPI00398BB1D7
MSKTNQEAIEVRPGEEDGYVSSLEGKPMKIPADWGLLPPGDAALSRRVKMEGPSWTVVEFKRRKKFSHGIFAPADRIERLKAEREAEKNDPAYLKKLNAGRSRRAKAEKAYAEEFEQAVFQFLDFYEEHLELANQIAKAVAEHAVPVGSGTVARTQRIPIEQRAESAMIAWMRHQTTAYDHMTIPREKGARREVRRMLAKESRRLLQDYRSSGQQGSKDCPLLRALG